MFRTTWQQKDTPEQSRRPLLTAKDTHQPPEHVIRSGADKIRWQNTSASDAVVDTHKYSRHWSAYHLVECASETKVLHIWHSSNL
jgi:hypothetical protein